MKHFDYQFKKKKLEQSDAILEHHFGDLWVRNNVSFQDDLFLAFDNEIKQIFKDMSEIQSFDWKIFYTIPYMEQIKNKSEKKYEVEEQNIHHIDIITFDGDTLFIVADLLADPPEIIIDLIKKFKNVQVLNIDCIVASGGFLDLEDTDDDYICAYLNNPNWYATFLFDEPSDIEDLKKIKAAIDPSIKIDLNDPELESKIL